MRAVVIYESLTGNTARAARLIAEAAREEGADVTIYPITAIGLKDLAEADIVFVGTWVDGLVLVGPRPGRATPGPAGHRRQAGRRVHDLRHLRRQGARTLRTDPRGTGGHRGGLH